MKRQFSVIILAGLFVASMVMFQNCSQVAFTPDEATLGSLNGKGNDGGGDPSCRTDYVNATKDVKVLFLVDASGSNMDSGATIGTDNNQEWRLKSLRTFVDAYKNKNNFFYGLLSFQGSSAQPHIKSGQDGIFTNNISEVEAGIASFDANADGGSTPYQEALKLAKSMISKDLIETSKPNAKPTAYVIVMISDGVPTDSRYKSSNGDGLNNLKADVKEIVDMSPGKISVNSVFLYSTAAKPTSSDEQYLRAMASVGGGAFIVADSKQTISIADSIQVPKETCQ